MYSQAIAYAFVFLPSNRIFVTFSSRALESDTNTLSTAYTDRFSFSFTHIFMQLEGKVFLQRAILFDLTREKNKKWGELLLMRIEGNRHHDRLPAQMN